jgi:hypothetical protein
MMRWAISARLYAEDGEARRGVRDRSIGRRSGGQAGVRRRSGLGGAVHKWTRLLKAPGSRLEIMTHRPISVHHFPRRAPTLCLQLCMGIQPAPVFPR